MSSGDIPTKRCVAKLLQVSERTIERWMTEGSIPDVPLLKRSAWSEAPFLRSEIAERMPAGKVLKPASGWMFGIDLLWRALLEEVVFLKETAQDGIRSAFGHGGSNA